MTTATLLAAMIKSKHVKSASDRIFYNPYLLCYIGLAIYRAFKKNFLMFVCLTSPEPINRFLKRFLLQKLRSINFKYRSNFVLFLGLKFLQNKTGFRSRQEHINTELKRSSQYQSGAQNCPVGGKSLTSCVIYEATVTQTLTRQKETYTGVTGRTFKDWLYEHRT